MVDLDDRTVVVISGPGGVGKGTIVGKLMSRDDRLWLSRSWTTRPPRAGELRDAYHFVDRAAFDAAVDAGRFLEWVEFLDYRQGTPRPEPPPDSDVILEIDVHGGAQVQARYRQAVLVFVEAPSPNDQQIRLRDRGDDDVLVAARLAKADEERAMAESLGYARVVNDDLDQAVAVIEDLIRDDRKRRRASRQGSSGC